MLGLHAFLVGALVLAAVAALWDVRRGTIPNALTVPAALFAVASHALAEARVGGAGAAAGAAIALCGALVCSLVPLLLFRRGAIGGGDVKLFAALGATLSPRLGIEAELYAFVVGALYAPARMAYEGRLLATLASTAALVANPFLPPEKRRALAPEMLTEMRFGPSILVGTLACVIGAWR